MAEPVLMKGNEAIGEAAILAGCRFFAGYPITPQNELPAYMAGRLPEVGGVFVQAESELSAINMIYGAAAAGARAMTSSSSPGISLKQEGISYLAGSELPCVVVNVMRAGPGLGGIQASQSDYFQATRGGGHGDYRTLVYAPASVQELVELTMAAFEAADRYRNPVMILADGILGQMMEPVDFSRLPDVTIPDKPWAITGARGRPRNIITSLYLDPEVLERHNQKLQEKYRRMAEQEVRFECRGPEKAELVMVAYGTSARIAWTAMELARAEGISVGLLRPITLWPFPSQPIRQCLDRGARGFLVVEMSAGQMVEDVQLAVAGQAPVCFHGRTGGMVPVPNDIVVELKKMARVGGRKYA